MRHIGSLLAGLAVAPLAWVLIAAGQPRAEQTFERWSTADSIYTGDVLGPLGLVVGAGLLVGLIVALRVSPVGPLVVGVFYLGVYGYAIREPVWVVDTLPQFSINGYRVDTVPPFANGTIALAGAVLVMAALSRRRWQRWPAAPAAGAEPAPAADGTSELAAVPESPAPAGVAPYTPNEVAPGPPPAVGEGPLWPSTVGATPYAQTEFDSPLTREAMYAGLTPGTAEDLPRRTPPKRPTAAEPGTGDLPAPTSTPPGGPHPPDPTRTDPGPTPGRTPPTPLIPSPRHAAPTEGWPLDSWTTTGPTDRPTVQPTPPPAAAPDRPADQPPSGPADRPTIQPTYQVPPEPSATDLTQPVQPSDLTQPVPQPGLPTAGPAGQQTPSGPAPQPPAQPAATQPAATQPAATQPDPHSTPADPAGPPDPAGQPDQAGLPLRPINPLAQRPVSPPPAGPPRPRPVNPLSTRPAPPSLPATEPTPEPITEPITGPAAGPSDSTQRLPGQATPADVDPDERPADPPTASPWSQPPRPPQET